MEPIIHYLIPLFILLVFFPKLDKKKAMLFALLGFAVDLDFFIPGFHRKIFYNIFFIALIGLIFYFIMNKESMYLALYFTIAHLLFDLSYPGIGLLYPLTNKTFFFDFNILAVHGIPKLNINYGIVSPVSQSINNISYFLATQGVLILILVIITLIISKRKEIKKFIRK